MRVRLPIHILALLLLSCTSTGSSAQPRQDPKLEVHVINVGQGDAVLVRCPEGTHELLIDSGELNQRYAEAEEEQLLVNDAATKALLDCDFLKVGHHASDTSSKPFFIDAVSPKVAAISCSQKGVGSNKGYKHPRLKTVKELLGKADAREGPALDIDAYDGDTVVWTTIKLNTAVYVTAAQGDLVFESDGSTIHKR